MNAALQEAEDLSSSVGTRRRQLIDRLQSPAHDGPTYEPDRDEKRLTSLRERVLSYMLRHNWVTLDELVEHCGGTTASVSAKLRDLRKIKHGAWPVQAERATVSLWRYRINAPLLNDAGDGQ